MCRCAWRPGTARPILVHDELGDDRKKLTGIADVMDLTDRNHGLRLVIELKNGFNPNAVLAELFKFTPMEDSFGINNVALVEGQPRTLGLLELLTVYVEHRILVVKRRTEYRLRKKLDRLHLVEGLLIAIVDIDEVIAIIRSSDETAQARERLIKIYDLSELQANHILELRLRQLTRFSRIELEKEAEELRAAIEELRTILSSEDVLRELVSSELADMGEKFATPRRTVLLESESGTPLKGTTMPAVVGTGKAAPLSLEIADDRCWVVLSATGQVARTVHRDPIDDSGARTKHDVLGSLVAATARGEIGGITSTGRMLRLQVVDLPLLPPANGFPQLAGGVKIAEFAQLAKGEKMVALVPLNQVIALGTANGVVKRLTPDYPLNRDEWEAITLKDKDTVIGPRLHRRRRPGLRDPRRPVAALCRQCRAPAGPHRRRHGGHQARHRGHRHLLRRGSRDRTAPGVRVDRHRFRRPARHRIAFGEGHRLRRIPVQGTCHRRCAGAPLPEGRGPAGAGLRRCGVRPARPRRPAWCGRCRPNTRSATVPACRWPRASTCSAGPSAQPRRNPRTAASRRPRQPVPLVAPEVDSLPFADSGVVQVEAAKRVAVQDSLLED